MTEPKNDPCQLFYADSELKRMYKIGKVGVNIGTYQALKLVESRFCTP